MTAPVLALESLIDRLHERGRLRVWSLVITVFGDAVVPRGGRIALVDLQSVMRRLRIEPGALRTALSRLASDGWVSRERQGRNSFYALADQGRQSFDVATRRIYASGHAQWDGGWSVIMAPPAAGERSATTAQLLEAGFVLLSPGVFLRPESASAPDPGALPEDMLVFQARASHLPADISAFWKLASLAASYRTFIEAYSPLARAMGKKGSLSPIDAMAARTLLVHDWRRIVLHDPSLPDALLPRPWAGDEARELARRIYRSLMIDSEAWMDGVGLPPLVDPDRFYGRLGLSGKKHPPQSR